MNLTNENKINLIKDLMKSNRICVISTVNSNGLAESAAMAFTEFDDFKILFQTPNYYRKYNNLKNNPNVSIVIGWEIDDMLTIQYEGTAIELNTKEVENYKKAHIAKNPESAKYADLPENKFFLVTPKWIRYSKLTETDPFSFELKYS